MKTIWHTAILAILTLTGYPGTAQSFNRDAANANLDFSAGDFSSWHIGWGPRTDADSAAGAQPGASSHTIIPIYGSNWDGSTGTDKLERVPSGLNTVARLGAPSGGGYGSPRAYGMYYDIKVNTRYPILFLQLASVMDKTHYTDYNTHYRFFLKNSSGTDIPDRPCSGLELYPLGTGSTAGVNTATIPDIGLKLLPDIGTLIYQPWQSLAIDLSAYAGQTVRLQLEHFDCWTGFHGSYEYLSAGMQPLTDTVYYCASDTLVTIKPYLPRFKSYSWNTGNTTEQLSVHHPVDGALYSCTVGSYNQCSTTFQYRLQAIKTEVNFSNITGSSCLEHYFTDISVTGSGTISSWQWRFGDPASGTADTSSLRNPVHNFSKAGTYILTLEVTTSKGCKARVQRGINVQEADVYSGYTSAFTGQCRSIQFTDTSYTTKGSINSWQWHFGDPGSGTGDTSSLRNPVHVFSKPGIYTVRLSTGTSIGCSGNSSRTIEVPVVPVPEISAANSCLGQKVPLSVNAGSLKSSSWDFGDGTAPSTGYSVTHTYKASGNYTVTLTVTDIHNCRDSTSKPVSVYPLPLAAISTVPAIAPKTNPMIRFKGLPGDMHQYSWDFGDGNTGNSSGQDTSHRYPETLKAYPVLLLVTDQDGCSDTATTLVQISAQEVSLPSAFTPNGDGRNDRFSLINVTNQQLEDFSIYNRYGQRVFQTKDSGKGWDGSFEGIPLEVGTYYYLVSLQYPDGVTETLKGDVALIR